MTIKSQHIASETGLCILTVSSVLSKSNYRVSEPIRKKVLPAAHTRSGAAFARSSISDSDCRSPVIEMGTLAAEARKEEEEIKAKGSLITRETCGAPENLRTHEKPESRTLFRHVLFRYYARGNPGLKSMRVWIPYIQSSTPK